jgi:ankyrin repeat protein
MKLAISIVIFGSFALNNHVHAAQATQQLQKEASQLELLMINDARKGTLTKDALANYLKQGAYINAQDNDGHTALIAASSMGDAPIAQILIDAGADVNAQNKHGMTALMLSFYYLFPDVAQMLIAANADIDIRNEKGYYKAAKNYAPDKQEYASIVAAGQKQRADYLARQKQAQQEIENDIFPGATAVPGIVNLISEYSYGPSISDLPEK